MIRMAAITMMLAIPHESSGQVAGGQSAPSGLFYAPPEALFEPVGAYDAARRLVRLRFVAPELADTDRYGIAQIEADFQVLCDGFGVEIVAQSAPNARQIVISVSAEQVAFGETAPNVAQYFDIFRIEDGTCVWEGI